jgi:uncharacterized protein (TIGR03083 family)
VEIDEHVAALRREGSQLADAAERAGLDAAVPPCQPWLVKDLLRHTGYIHRWAARHVTECPPSMLDGPPEAEILQSGAADPDLISWFRAGHAALVETLLTADPGVQCPTFIDAPSSLAFWARRQAHETAIHRADADSATGIRPQYPADFAADGVDELIMGFGQRRKYRPSAAHDGTMRVQLTDTGDAWHVGAEAGRLQARREPASISSPASTGSPASADCTVSGPASGVYLFLWNRSDAATADVSITGDTAFLTGWQSSVRVRWG